MRVLMLTLACACAGAPPGDSDADPARPRRLLLLGVDGVRADAFDAADTPALDAAFAPGARTLTASTQLTGVTVSGPGWASVLTGVEVEDHGVVDNDHLFSRSDAWPTLPERARGEGLFTGAAIHWNGVGLLSGPDAFDAVVAYETDAEVSDALLPLIADSAYDVVVAHFDDVDHAGHATGFSADNPDYVGAIEGVDAFAAPALTAVADRAGQEDWLVIFVTDHGGSGTGHGPMDADNQTIPMAMVGGGVTTAPATPFHMDVAATAAAWLGVPADGLDGDSWLP